MKHILIIGWFCAFAFHGRSQTITIKDKETAQSVPLVTLSSNSPKAYAVTDAHGQADISRLKGADRIEIRMLGFATRWTSFAELEKNGFQLELNPSLISLNQVVVSHARWSQNRSDVPAKITTMSAKEVALQNPQTAADLLGATGEVFIQKSQQGGGSPMIRGFATNRVLLTVDGVRMNTAIFRSGNVQNVINIDPFATESAEILFGPGSVIYGSDAIAGVMNFTTLTPTLSKDNEVVVSGKALSRYSSANNEKTMHLDVNLGWKKWSMVTSLTSSDYDNLRMGSYGPNDYLKPFYVQRMDSEDRVLVNEDSRVQNPSGYEQVNLMQKVRFRPNDKWDFNYAFHYSTTSDYARYDRTLRMRNGLPRSAEWNYGPQTWMMNTMSITHTATNGIYDEVTLRLAQQYFEESRMDRNLNSALRYVRTERVIAYSENLDFYKNIGARQKIFYGTEGIFNDVNSLGRDQNIVTGGEAVGPSRYPQSTWSSVAAYMTYQFKLTGDLTLQAGARYNQFMLDARFDTNFYPLPFTSALLNDGALTGSAGLVFSPGETWSMSANLSTGFRAPNVDDLGKVFDSEPGAVVVPNPSLGAEYAYNAEAGIAKVFGDFLKIDATGFYTLLQHAMVRRDFQLNGLDSIFYDGQLSRVQAIQNAAQATVYGVQAGFEAKLPAGFGLWGRVNMQQGVEELDNGDTDPLRHAAPLFSTAHFTYAHQHLKLDLYAVYNDDVRPNQMSLEEKGKPELYASNANGDLYVPAWYTLNFKAMMQVSDHLAISGGVENITDVRYRPYSSGLAGAGRNVVISARVMF